MNDMKLKEQNEAGGYIQEILNNNTPKFSLGKCGAGMAIPGPSQLNQLEAMGISYEEWLERNKEIL